MQEKSALLFVQGFCFAIFFRIHSLYNFDSPIRNSVGSQTTSETSVLLRFLSYDQLSAYIHQCYLCNVGNGSDSNRELQYDIQFVKVFTTRQIVCESLKYNIITNLKRKYYSSKEEPSASNFLKKSKTSDNVKYISLPSKPSVDEKCVERFSESN